jgi:hypothetical protein
MDDTSLFTAKSRDFEVDVAEAGYWVYDYQGPRMFLFDSTGALVRRIGRQAAVPGEFASGNGLVALPDTGIADLGAQNARVSFFAANGDFPARASGRRRASRRTTAVISDPLTRAVPRRPITAPREGEILGRMGLVRLKPMGSFGDFLHRGPSRSARCVPGGESGWQEPVIDLVELRA